MGFSVYEKKCFRESLEDQNIELYFPDDVVDYLNSEGLQSRVRDYAIISDKSKYLKPEHLVVTYLLTPKRTVFEILKDWQTFLSPPVRFNYAITHTLKFLSFASTLTVPYCSSIIIKSIATTGHRLLEISS